MLAFRFHTLLLSHSNPPINMDHQENVTALLLLLLLSVAFLGDGEKHLLLSALSFSRISLLVKQLCSPEMPLRWPQRDQKSLEYFIWEFLWRHSRATLARLCHLNPLSLNHGSKSRCQEPKNQLIKSKVRPPQRDTSVGTISRHCVSSEILLAAKQDRHQKHYPPR